MIIYKGDQYSLPIKIKTKDGEPITPEQVDGVKINVNGVTEVYPNGALVFDAETSQWLYPLTQTETLGLYGKRVKVQCQIRVGDCMRGTPYKMVDIGSQVIKEVWE